MCLQIQALLAVNGTADPTWILTPTFTPTKSNGLSTIFPIIFVVLRSKMRFTFVAQGLEFGKASGLKSAVFLKH
ncbi:MAG TPA: hypothetical protein VGO57_14840 [Verrucomicrobiae bacterium]|jgi:hypothetical protein